MLSDQQLKDKALLWKEALPLLEKICKPVVPQSLQRQLVKIDLSAGNSTLVAMDLADTNATAAYIAQEIARTGAPGAIGGYLENRLFYLRSAVFAGVEHRTLHLGIDLWLPAETAVYNLLPGNLHSFADNEGFGDYGPTIILAHQLAGLEFYSLYGHLSRASLRNLKEGDFYEAGAQLGYLGTEAENGNWPPHLHLQIMLDMHGRRGDFPGVAAPSQKDYWEMLCPNPEPLLDTIN